jgi:hypothetical protein
MNGLKEYMRHFHAWAGIQRTRHEHRCAVTQPNPQDFSANVSMLYSRLSRTIRPPITDKSATNILLLWVFFNLYYWEHQRLAGFFYKCRFS